MNVISTGPLRVAHCIWQPRAGSFVLTIISKATFRLEPGTAVLEEQQEAPNEHDNYWDDEPTRSLYAPSDIVPFKAHADVLLVGHAFAPGKQPVHSLVARLAVGSVSKSVKVHGDRVWTKDGQLREGMPFIKMPLRYERASGGPDTWNPVGMRVDAAPDGYGAVPLPNLQPPLVPLDRTGRLPPVGFGPIAPSWPLRADKLGRHAATWTPRSFLERPIPEDLDPGYWSAAPADQQVEALAPDASIVLENLHPEHPRLFTRLPGISARAVVEGAGRRREEIAMACDTLWIDTDLARCTLVFRGRVALRHAREACSVTVSMESSAGGAEGLGAVTGQTLLGPHALLAQQGAGRPPSRSEDSEIFMTTIMSGEDLDLRTGRMPTLPFVSLPDAPGLEVGALVTPSSASPSFASPESSGAGAPSSKTPLEIEPEPVTPQTNQKLLPQGSSSTGPTTEPMPAAAGASAVATAPRRRTDPPWSAPPETPRTGPAIALPEALSHELVELMWFSPGALPRLRLVTAFGDLLTRVPPREAPDALDDELLLARISTSRERREVLTILTHGEALGVEGVGAALLAAVDEDGTFSPPVVLLGGELEVSFDPLDVLKATFAAVSVLSASDPKLSERIEALRVIFTSPWVEGSPSVLEELCGQVREAFAEARRAFPARYLETHTTRTLLAHRQFQRRVVLGQPRLRCLLSSPGVSGVVPAYLPEALASELPAFQRFRVRLVAEVRARLDQSESHPAALRVLALGRVIA